MPILSKYPQSSEDLLMKNSPIPISAKCPYSVSMMAMLNYMWIEIDHASFSLNCLRKVSLQKYWSSTQSLNYYVHVSTLLFKVMRLSQNFSEIAWLLFWPGRIQGNKHIFFLCCWSPWNKYHSFVWHTMLLFLKREISTFFLISTLFWISILPRGNKSKKHRRCKIKPLWYVAMCLDMN